MPNDLINVCNLKEEEIAPVLEIDRLSFSRAEDESFFKNQNRRCLVVKFDGKPVGYLVYEKVLDEVHILRFGVHPDFRRKGIGKSLLEETFKYGKKFYLEARKSNVASQNLCESLGFKIVGERKGYYQDSGEDALLFARV